MPKKSYFDQVPGLRSPPTFTDFAHDRLAERRDDAEFVRALLNDPKSTAILVANDSPLVAQLDERTEIFFSMQVARAFEWLEEPSLLGMGPQGAVFAIRVKAGETVDSIAPSQVVSADLRSFALQGLAGAPELGLLAQAKSLLYWHARNQRCSNCGEPTRSGAAGWRRECVSCGAQHFPRTDPVVIMLAVDGDWCLLGRQARFAPGTYSALAGFLEPGETLENAVRREVREEAGIRIGRVAYLGSQPWPFPASLMLGCIAEALSRELCVDRSELEDARWFSRAEAHSMVAGTHPDGLRAPNRIAIAHRLLESWLAEDAG